MCQITFYIFLYWKDKRSIIYSNLVSRKEKLLVSSPSIVSSQSRTLSKIQVESVIWFLSVFWTHNYMIFILFKRLYSIILFPHFWEENLTHLLSLNKWSSVFLKVIVFFSRQPNNFCIVFFYWFCSGRHLYNTWILIQIFII